MALIKYDDWKYATGEGWASLINEAIDLVNKFNNEHPNLEYPVHIVDIKEKWGILQIDLDFYYDNLDEQIIDICLRSRNVCEYCGTTENVKTSSIHGYMQTLCPKCKNDQEQHLKKLTNNY